MSRTAFKTVEIAFWVLGPYLAVCVVTNPYHQTFVRITDRTVRPPVVVSEYPRSPFLLEDDSRIIPRIPFSWQEINFMGNGPEVRFSTLVLRVDRARTIRYAIQLLLLPWLLALGFKFLARLLPDPPAPRAFEVQPGTRRTEGNG